MRLRSKLTLEGLQNIRRNVKGAVHSATIRTARKVALDAAERAPKDTTFLAESIHVAAYDFTDYDLSFATANETFDYYKALGKTPKGRHLGPKSQYYFFPEIRPKNPNEVWVVVGAMHGASIEYGVHTRQAFLAPALYNNRGTLTAEIKRAFNGMSVRAQLSRFTSLDEPGGVA